MIILLVEDSRFFRMVNEKTLTKAGYIVVSAADGETALQIAREQVPDLILLDMMLPKLDGISVLRALKHDPVTSNIPVIVLSSLGEKNEAKLLQEGAVAYFQKSDSMLAKNSEALIQIVRNVMGSEAAIQIR